MKVGFARLAIPMAALLARVGLSRDKADGMPLWQRERVARTIRRQVAPSIARYRDTKSSHALSRRRAKNKVARATRKAHWRAIKVAA